MSKQQKKNTIKLYASQFYVSLKTKISLFSDEIKEEEIIDKNTHTSTRRHRLVDKDTRTLSERQKIFPVRELGEEHSMEEKHGSRALTENHRSRCGLFHREKEKNNSRVNKSWRIASPSPPVRPSLA